MPYSYFGSDNHRGLVKVDDTPSSVWTYQVDYTIIATRVDPSGYVYIGVRYSTYETHKISPDGTNVWTYSHGTDSPQDVIADTSGNVYVVLTNNTLIKLDPNGVLLWTTNLTHMAYDLGIDVNDNVYLSQDDIIEKRDFNGNLVWASASRPNSVEDISLDYAGYVFGGDGAGNIFKLDSSGSLVWSVAVATRIEACAVNAIGDVVCTDQDSVFKVNDSGTIWSILGPDGRVNDIAIDTNSDIYIAAKEASFTLPCWKVDNNGNKIWSFDIPFGDAYSVAVDPGLQAFWVGVVMQVSFRFREDDGGLGA